MPKEIVPIWSPADYREVFERAATVQAIRAVSDECREVAESRVLDFIMVSAGIK